MDARQTSIKSTAAPLAPTLATNVETKSAVLTTPAVVFPTRVKLHPSTITSLLALVSRVGAATIAPRKVLAVRFAHAARRRLSFQNLRAKITRTLFRTTANHVEISLT